MFFSPSMLERVYVRGSLTNTENGFSFQLKNTVDHGTLSGVKSLTVDGSPVAVDALTLQTTKGQTRAAEVGPRSPLSLPYNAEVTVYVAGQHLNPGAHALELALTVYEAGALTLKFNDTIAN